MVLHSAAKEAQLAEWHDPRLVGSIQATSSYITQIAYPYPDATNKQKKGIEKDLEKIIAVYDYVVGNSLVDIARKSSDMGPPRKFFSLNAAGRAQLALFWEKWAFVESKINELKGEQENV